MTYFEEVLLEAFIRAYVPKSLLRLSNKDKKYLGLFFFIVFSLLVFYDMLHEFLTLHTAAELWQAQTLEIAIFLLGSFSFCSMWMAQRREEISQTTFNRELSRLKEEKDEWKSKSTKFIQEYQDYIESHFDTWNFSATEKEIGIFLIKGLSIKEIAQIREVSEKTIRNQTLLIYSKSGLAGRHELSAYFLEELLKPVTKL